MKDEIIDVNVKKILEIKKGDTAIYLDDIDEILFLINELKVAFDDIDREFLDE